jgi:hypothetical protein
MYGRLASAPLLVIAMTGPALAQTPEQETARNLFRAGLGAMKDEQYSLACPRFAEAHRLDPK